AAPNANRPAARIRNEKFFLFRLLKSSDEDIAAAKPKDAALFQHSTVLVSGQVMASARSRLPPDQRVTMV
ncbi:MAG: hypothetical protein ACLP8B_09880, partial [Xanthobacteraceae bacterium]